MRDVHGKGEVKYCTLLFTLILALNEFHVFLCIFEQATCYLDSDTLLEYLQRCNFINSRKPWKRCPIHVTQDS